jgi:hypothetical protein
VAEGARGRRWRASTRTAEGTLLDDLLLEVEPGGRIARLELTTAAGQLTFHAEPDEDEAHGNVVTPRGMRHVALRWARGRGVEIASSPIADAVLAAGRGSGDLVVARIGPDLVPTPGSVAIEAHLGGRWRVAGREVHLDEADVPVFEHGASWAMEEAGLVPD